MATIGVAAYSITAGSNTSAGGVSTAEGMSPAAVNNAMRAIMADLAIDRNLIGGLAVSGGSANAQTLTTGMTLAAYQQGLLMGFEAGYTNTGTTTLNVDSVGAKTVKRANGSNLAPGDITAGGLYLVAYETTADALILLTPSDTRRKVVSILVFNDSQNCATGDGAGDVFFRIPAELNGFDLVAVAACCQTAGTTNTMDIQIRNVTQAADMLTTKITIDSAETDSLTAATPAVIDTGNDDVATGDQIRIDVDAVHSTPAKGLLVELTFRLP